MSLKNGQHQGPGRQAHALVANAAQLASAVVAIGILAPWIGLRCWLRMHRVSRMRLGRRRRHGFMAVMPFVRLRVLRRADRRHHSGMVRTTLHHRHPGTRPQPQGHQAQQEAKENSVHPQIISQGSPSRTSQTGKPLIEPGEATRHSKHPARPHRPTGCAHGCPWPAPCPAPRPIGQSC